MFHRIDELDRATAFERVADRHHQARVSRRLLALAVIVLLAVLATRVAAAAPGPQVAPAPAVASDCDGDLGCDDAGDGTEASSTDDTGEDMDLADTGIVPRIVKRSARGGEPCVCPSALLFPIAEVAAAAVRAAGLDQDPTPSWNKRTRLAGLVPMLSARVGRNLTWKDVDVPTLGYTNMYDVRATWHLERLLFDPNEIRIAAVDVSRRREKRRVEMLAVHSYLTWLRLPRASPRAVMLAADLDAITGGWFSLTLAKRGKP